MTVVDVHTHYVPAFVVEALAARGELHGLRGDAEQLVTAGGLRLPLHYRDLHDPAAKLAGLDARSIDVAAISLTPHLFVYRPEHDPVTFARRANDALARYVAADDRLVGLATLPIVQPAAAAEELERCVTELGFAGAQIGTSLPDGTPLDRAGLDDVFDAAQAARVPLVLHPYYAGPIHDPELFLNNSIGVPLDTCIAATRLLVSGTLDRWPELRLVFVHGGGYLPYQLGRLDNAYAVRGEVRAAARKPPRAYLSQCWFDTIVHSDDALRFLAALVGEDRLLLGTDLPYMTAEQRPVERALQAGLDPHALGGNALSLLGIESEAIDETTAG